MRPPRLLVLSTAGARDELGAFESVTAWKPGDAPVDLIVLDLVHPPDDYLHTIRQLDGADTLFLAIGTQDQVPAELHPDAICPPSIDPVSLERRCRQLLRLRATEEAQIRQLALRERLQAAIERPHSVEELLSFFQQFQLDVTRAAREREEALREVLQEEQRLRERLQEELAERRRTEEALRESQERYSALFTAITDAVYVHHITDEGLPGTFIEVNDVACEMLGYTRDEFLSMDVGAIDAPESKVDVRHIVERLRAGENVLFEQTHVAKDGTRIPVEVHAHAFHFRGRLAVLSTVRDITERRHVEEELRKAQKLESLGILAGGIAHDFNNILLSLWGNTQLAAIEVDPGSKAAELLAESEQACVRARDLTQQLLTFAKGGAPIKKTASVSRLIKDCASFSLRGSNVRCEHSVPGDLWAVEIDQGQMSQVITNLIINADQAMPEGGVIRVVAENIVLDSENQEHALPLEDGNYVKIRIEDEGVGIPREHLSKIFDPYFTTKQKGSGLGLATSYSIVKRHDGHLRVESQPSVGTTFEIYLPASEAPLKPEEHKETRHMAGERRILFMDDEEQLRSLAGQMLKHLGYRVAFAEDGSEAIEAYRQGMESKDPFAAVILDLTVPGRMGGQKAIRKLREIDPDVVAIVSSGYSHDPIMANYREHGFKGVIAKPYKLDELGEVLHAALNARRGTPRPALKKKR